MIEELARELQLANKTIEELRIAQQDQLGTISSLNLENNRLNDELLSYKGKSPNAVRDLKLAELTSRVSILTAVIGMLIHRSGDLSRGINRKSLLDFIQEVQTEVKYEDNFDMIIIRNEYK